MLPSQIDNVNQLVTRLIDIGNVIIYLLMSLGVIYVVYAVVQYLIKGRTGDESRKEAGMHILWGIVGLAIIFSLWGLINILIGTFGTNTNNMNGRLPSADFTGSSNSGSTLIHFNASRSGTSVSGSLVPTIQNNYNTVSGSNSNTQNYNH